MVFGTAKGTTGGGTYVLIFGTNLAGVTAVHFGLGAAAEVDPDYVGATDAESETEIGVPSPPGLAGTVDVTVTTAVGTSTHQSIRQAINSPTSRCRRSSTSVRRPGPWQARIR